MWLCLLTYHQNCFPNLQKLSTHHPNKIYQPSCANELQMSWQHAFNHLHGPLLQCLGRHAFRGASWFFKGMDFFYCKHRVTTMQYCFEDHLVHSVKFRLKIWYIIDSLIRTHDPDDNWPRTTWLSIFPSDLEANGWVFHLRKKTPTPGLLPPASRCGWCSSNLWRRKRFGTLMVFWSPSQLMEKNDSSKRLPGMAGKQTSNTFGTKSFGLQKRKECSSHWDDIIWTFLSIRRFVMISAECERMVVRTVRIYDSIYYDMHDLRLLVIDMSFLSTSLRLTHHQLVPLNLLSSWFYRLWKIALTQFSMIWFDSVWRHESWTLFRWFFCSPWKTGGKPAFSTRRAEFNFTQKYTYKMFQIISSQIRRTFWRL